MKMKQDAARTAARQGVAPISQVDEDQTVVDFEDTADVEDTRVSSDAVPLSSQVAITAYIANQTNTVATHVVPNKEGAEAYRKLYEAEMAKPEDKRIKPQPKLDAKLQKVTGKKAADSVTLKKEYNQTRFRSLFPEAYKKIQAKNYVKVIFAETKPEYFVFRNLLVGNSAISEELVARVSEKLKLQANAADYNEGIYVIKRKNLVAFVAAMNSPYIPVLDWPNNQDPERPEGKVLIHRKVTSKKKPIYVPIYIKRDKEGNGIQHQVPTIFELGIPYAINTDKSENKGVITDVEAQVLNKDDVVKYYGKNFKYQELGTKKNLTSSGSGLTKEALKQAKEDCIIPYGKGSLGKKFAEIGLSPELVAELRTNKPIAGKKDVPIETLLRDHRNSINQYSREKASKRKH